MPERIDISVPITPLEVEATRYEQLRSEIEKQASIVAVSLAMLGKLRMFCTHPAVVEEGAVGDPTARSSKYKYFCSLVDQIKAGGEKLLVFTS